jgi:hypothetical protein
MRGDNKGGPPAALGFSLAEKSIRERTREKGRVTLVPIIDDFFANNQLN